MQIWTLQYHPLTSKLPSSCRAQCYSPYVDVNRFSLLSDFSFFPLGFFFILFLYDPTRRAFISRLLFSHRSKNATEKHFRKSAEPRSILCFSFLRECRLENNYYGNYTATLSSMFWYIFMILISISFDERGSWLLIRRFLSEHFTPSNTVFFENLTNRSIVWKFDDPCKTLQVIFAALKYYTQVTQYYL